MSEGFRDSISAENAANSATVAVTIPATIQAGDVMLAWHDAASNGATVTTPAGWTPVYGPVDKSTVLREYLFVKAATAADAGSTLTVTKSVADSTKKYLTLVAYSGVDNTTPIMDFNTAVEAVAGTSHTAPTVTVTGTGTFVVEHMVDRGSPASTDITPPSGFTERVQQVGTGTGTLTVEACDSTAAVAAGTRGGDVLTGTVSTANAIMATVALKAAGGTSATATPGVLNATASFFTPTILNGSTVRVNPDVLRATATFYPVVGAGTAQVTPDLLTATFSFFPPTVQAQITALTVPDPIRMSVTFSAPTVTAEVNQPGGDGGGTNPPPSSGLFKFRSPTFVESWPLALGERLAVKVEVNLTMYRTSGVWHAGSNLTYSDLAGADRVYYGGYDVTVPDDELAEMVAQGFDVAVAIDDAGSADFFLDLFTETF